MSADERSSQDEAAGDVDPVRGQSIEEAEKNLSRHATRNSSPLVDEQWRTNVPEANEREQEDLEQGERDGNY